MVNNGISYQIIGASTPCVEVMLDSHETVIAEAGAMNYFDAGVSFKVTLGDGSEEGQGLFGKVFSAAKRALSNESLFITHFTNNSTRFCKVSFSAPYPGQIVAIDLATLGGTVYCQKNAFLCGTLGTKLSMAFSKKMGAGFFGGEGFILQKLEGQGTAFIHAGGSIVEKVLNSENDTIYVETGSLVGFSEGVEFDIEATTSLKSFLFGGEGLYLTKLSGRGKVWIQAMPFNRLTGILYESLRGRFKEDFKTGTK